METKFMNMKYRSSQPPTSSKALLRNAEISHIITHEKKTFGIEGDATMAFGPTHQRSRGVADASAKGVHYLMKKNKITELDGWGTLKDAKTIAPEKPFFLYYAPGACHAPQTMVVIISTALSVDELNVSPT